MIGMSLGVVADIQDEFGDIDAAYTSLRTLKNVLKLLAIFLNDAIAWESPSTIESEPITARYLGSTISVDETGEIISRLAQAMGVTMPQGDADETNDAEKELEAAVGVNDGDEKNVKAE